MPGNRDVRTVFHSNSDTGQLEVVDAELCTIRVTLQRSSGRAEALRAHWVMEVVVCSDSLAAITRMAHLDPGRGQQLPRAINKYVRALRAHGIEAVIHSVPGHSGIPGNTEANWQANKEQENRGYTLHDCINTSAVNRARCSCKGRTAAKVQWEANNCSH